jgi:hypothetical protein
MATILGHFAKLLCDQPLGYFLIRLSTRLSTLSVDNLGATPTVSAEDRASGATSAITYKKSRRAL